MQHDVDDVHGVRVYLLLHVVVLVTDFSHDGAFAISGVHLFGTAQDEVLAVFEAVAVVVADDVAEPCLLNVRLDAEQVVETLIALRLLRRLVLRQHLGKLGGQRIGVHHFTLGIARVYADAAYDDLGRSGVEVLELQFAHVATVHRVGPVAAEALDVEVVGAATYFLVGVEGDANLSVLDFLVLLQVDHCLHDFSDTCLVVGSEQRVTIRHDEVFADVLQQFRKLLGRKNDLSSLLFPLSSQEDVRPVVLMHQLGVDVGSRAVGTGVVV